MFWLYTSFKHMEFHAGKCKAKLLSCVETLTISEKEYVAVLIELYKKNVSCVGSDLLSEWPLSTANSDTPQYPEWRWLYWNNMLDQIRLWADINRNCNIFFLRVWDFQVQLGYFLCDFVI